MSRILKNVLKSATRLREAALIDQQTFEDLKEASGADVRRSAAGKTDRQ